MVLHVWIGFDHREPLTYKTCVQSILEHAQGKVVLHKLDTQELRQRGLFSREWRVTAEGQFVDILDGKPFSTAFSHSRFLVPHLAREAGTGPAAVFMDPDMVLLDDITKVLGEVPASSAVAVVKHDFKGSGMKMDAKVQTSYKRKLWSAFMVFDPWNPYCKDLTPDQVNTQTGTYLHQFGWCPDHLIGSLAEGWNYIPEHSKDYQGPIYNVHYTKGTGEFSNYVNAPMMDIWYKSLVKAMA